MLEPDWLDFVFELNVSFYTMQEITIEMPIMLFFILYMLLW